MDFALNEEQLELQEMVREFVEKEITPYAAEMDEQNHWRDGLMEKANEMGLLNVIVPEGLRRCRYLLGCEQSGYCARAACWYR